MGEAFAEAFELLESVLAGAPEDQAEQLVAAVAAACLDQCPAVKISGCRCAGLLASRELTEEQWEALLDGLAYKPSSAAGHQHAKVRERWLQLPTGACRSARRRSKPSAD